MSAVRLRDGLELFVRDRGDGPALLLGHGFTGSGEAWGQALLEELARDFRVLCADLLGHGRSARCAIPKRYRVEAQVDDLCDVLDACRVDRAAFVGYSMGGRISLAAAVRRPERVAALVLEGASPGLPTAAERSQRREADEALARRLEGDDLGSFVDAWMKLPLFETQRRLGRDALAAERRRRLRNDPLSLAASLRGAGSGSQPSYWDELDSIAVPVLLVAGSEDRKFSDLAGRMAERIPKATFASVPGSGHCVHLERPDAWLGAVHPFLEDTARRRGESE
jgi:2-succinyl-6-hydroxy-2,4-cyclohexadiene-1-carboxylate synthase